jgi:starch-binding outer membrane protein, SusD/RagB family
MHKMKNMKYAGVLALLLLVNVSCDMEIVPSDGITKDQLAQVPNGLEYATNGNYSMFKDILLYNDQIDTRNTYVRHLNQMAEYPGDNVTLSGSTPDHLFYAATMQHFPGMLNTTYFWYAGYKVINGANQAIEATQEGQDGQTDQLLGENYFLRGMVQFDLLRFFAKPYTHGVDNPGILLRLVSGESDLKERSTVGECYAQVVSDLEKAALLMTTENHRGIEFASLEAAWALLSRVYLYMENNEKAIEYATKVIESSRFQLETRANYVNSFWNTPNSLESIFIIKHQLQDDKVGGSIGSMYLTDRGLGWGEVYVSEPLLELYRLHPEDVRNDLIKPDFDVDGVTVKQRNGIPKYFITKFSYQDDFVTLSSPQILRLSEMYLNRAEAYVKTGSDQLAVDDINTIRERAGLSGDALYAVNNFQGAPTLLDAVLQERRMELAYEGHRSFDVFRNKKSLDRSFPGVHLPEGQNTLIVNWDNPRIIYFIPNDEIFANPAADQNE